MIGAVQVVIMSCLRVIYEAGRRKRSSTVVNLRPFAEPYIAIMTHVGEPYMGWILES